jgi:hypothetical protein
MDVRAWCGHCGESFRLAELVDPAFSGRCPRCGAELAPGYVPVASVAVHDVARAARELHAATARLRDVAPRLHLDVRRLADDLRDAAGETAPATGG